MKKKSSLRELSNIGKVIAGKLERIGIGTKDDFLACDPYDIFDRLLAEVDPSL